jgi:hypothetical protein
VPLFVTSRAWSDAHADLFTRNIYTYVGDADSEEARAYNEWASNAQTVTWPDLAEVQRWDAQNAYPGSQAVTSVEALQLALDAAVSRLAERCGLYVRPVDANGDVDPDGDPVPIPPEVKLATILQAVRWARRRQTPDGLAGSAEITGLIRTSSIDPDIEALIANHRRIGLA